ncbi:Matrix-remodeling-associated protein 5 [Triplophysa tibetana]|uniref:Matrix-remodeling-associated protein 5 n=1 Tax=Triplophysa tibetana TaxID=1572043 RepID=A0A5A9PKW1_9TELE|nr:Matrix-remodeling-associated protein 5 [Triplophysa tibetana]
MLVIGALHVVVRCCPRACTCQQPTEVHCTFRSLLTVPAGVPKQVERMNLGFNTISLTSLRILQLEGNQLQQLHSATFCTFSILGHFPVSSLKQLHLSDNLLTTLSQRMFAGMPYLENLFLHGNPWTCDCRMKWFKEWNTNSPGVLKCKKDRAYPEGQLCPMCSSQKLLKKKLLQELENPSCNSPIASTPNLKAISTEETESDLLTTDEFLQPLGNISLGLSDEHGHQVDLYCLVTEPKELTSISWHSVNPHRISANVTLTLDLKCPIERSSYEKLWRLIAYYSDVPAHLQREIMLNKDPYISYRYRQDVERDALYYTGVKANIAAEPQWIMQSSIDLQLNRLQSTSKIVRLILSTHITQIVEPDYIRQQKREWVFIESKNDTRTMQVAMMGSPVEMSCSIHSSGNQTVKWMLPDGSTLKTPYSSSDNRLSASSFGLLEIKSVDHSDSGVYYCIAHVSDDLSVLPLRLTVEESSSPPPGVEGVTETFTGFAGGTVSLPCVATGSPDADIHWIRPDGSIVNKWQNNSRTLVALNGTLIIRHSQLSDSGYYKCVAGNQHGMDTLVTKMIITKPPGMIPLRKYFRGPQPAEGVSTKIKVLMSNDVESSGDNEPEELLEKTLPRRVELPNRRKVPNMGGHPSRKSWRRPAIPRRRVGTTGVDRVNIVESKRRNSVSNNQIDPKRWASILAKVRNGGTSPEITTVKTVQTSTNRIQEPVTAYTKQPGITNKITGSSAESATTRVPEEMLYTITTAWIPIQTTEFNLDIKALDSEDQRNVIYQIAAPESDSNSNLFTARTYKAHSTVSPHMSYYTIRDSEVTDRVQTSAAWNTKSHGNNLQKNLSHSMGSGSVNEATLNYNDEYTVSKSHEDVVEVYQGRTDHSLPLTTAKTHTEQRAGTHGDAKLFNVILTTVRQGTQTLQKHTTHKKPSVSEFPLLTTLTPTTKPASGDNKATFSNSLSASRASRARNSTSSRRMTGGRRKKPNRIRTKTNSFKSSVYVTNATPQPTSASIAEVTKGFSVVTKTTASSETKIETSPWAKNAKAKMNTTVPLNDSQVQSPGKMTHEEDTDPLYSGRNHQTHQFLPHERASVTKERHLDDAMPAQKLNTITPVPVFPSTSISSGSEEIKTTMHVEENSTLPSLKLGIHEWFTSTHTPAAKTSAETFKMLYSDKATSTSRIVDPDNVNNILNSDERLVTPGQETIPKVELSETYSRTTPPVTQFRHQLSYVSDETTSQGLVKVNIHKNTTTKAHTIPLQSSTISPSQQRIPGRSGGTFFTIYHTTSRRVEQRPTAVPEGRGRPHITSTDIRFVKAQPKTVAYLPCVAVGKPSPFLSWTKVSTGVSIAQNTRVQRFQVHSNGTLVIHNVLPLDQGHYLCSVQNQYGEDKIVVNLIVEAEHPKVLHPRFREATAYLGETVEMMCQSQGNPKPRITWVQPDRAVVHSGVSTNGMLGQRVSVSPNGTLYIKSAIHTDRGIYKCISSNALGADTISVRLTVVALPPIIKQPSQENVSLSEGSTAFLNCTAMGAPHPSIAWITPDGMQLHPLQFINSRNLFVFPNGTLFVRSLVLTDTGRYECYVTNAVGTAQRTIILTVRKSMKSSRARITFSSSQKTDVVYGDRLHLGCIASGNPEPRIIWRTPLKKLVDAHYSYDPRIKVSSNGTLTVVSVTEKDAGEYLCVARNKIGDDFVPFKVSVLTKPAKIEQKTEADKKVMYGGHLKVDCVASGLPDPKIKWALPDGTMINSVVKSDRNVGSRSRRYVVFDNGTLFFNEVGIHEEGDYTCYAENQVGKDEMKVHVKVVSAVPVIENKTHDVVRVLYGESVSLNCSAKGDPKPLILWFSPTNRAVPSASDKYKIHNNGTLVIQKVQRFDGGNYVCLARNSAGQDRKVTRVEILVSPPAVNGLRGTANSLRVSAVRDQHKLIDCETTGTPIPHVMWVLPENIVLPTPYYGSRMTVHRNGTLDIRSVRMSDSGKLACIARNEGGETRLVVHLDVTDTLEKPKLRSPKMESLSLTVGRTINLNCSVEGSPAPQVTWILPNGSLLLSGAKFNKFLHNSDGTLIISNPTLSEAGTYRCLGRNEGGLVERTVALMPGHKPEINNRYDSPISVINGENVQLHCLSNTNSVYLTWTLPSGMVLNRPQKAGRYAILPNGTLSIQQASVHDRGSYTCRTSNEYGSSLLTVPVIIIAYAPHITSGPSPSTYARRGVAVQFNCVATGIPKAEVAWETPERTRLVVGSQPRLFGNKYLHPQGSLIIQNPTAKDAGLYRCTARNVIGIDSKACNGIYVM